MTSIEILKKLISFDTISSNSNLELISFCKQILENAGAKVTIIKNKEEQKVIFLQRLDLKINEA